MDRDLIAASIEVAYAETIQRLPASRQTNFGLHFLAKLVQLSVAVPAPGPTGIERLLDSIGDGLSLRLPRNSAFYAEEQRRGADGVSLGRELLVEGDPDQLPEGDYEQITVHPHDLEVGSSRPEAQIDESSPQFHAAERLAVRYLEANPREVKRFDNAFRLQLQVARRTPGCEVDFSEGDLIAIGSWVAMRLRWPDLAVSIDRDEGLLARLERDANDADYDSDDKPWCDDALLTALLREDDESRRIARLQDRTFLRIS